MPVPAPPPALRRDAWALVPPVAALILAAHAWFSFIGEPVADDFDFLHHSFFSGRDRWFDGGGSQFYWRPVARQLYYRLLGDVMLAHPAWVPALQSAFLALAGLLLYRVLRKHWPGAWAAAAASFPLVLEASRTLISSATSFQDLGAILFSALALHEASRARLASALAALLAALLCKEMAVVTALAMPLLAASATDATPRSPKPRSRLRWAVAVGVTTGAWMLTYRLVLGASGLLLARDAGQDPRALATDWLARFAWACRESLSDAMSLPALTPPLRLATLSTLGAFALVLVLKLAVDRSARGRVRAMVPWVVGGLAWFALATATLADVYPDWRPYRSPFGAIGLGVACTALLGAAQPQLLAGLVALRLATFVLSPGPPAAIAPDVAGAHALDFAKLVNLQRLVGETRLALAAALPAPATGARVATQYFPRGALHAFAGDRSLQTWYRDTTLRWVTIQTAVAHRGTAPVVALELEPPPPGLVVAVNPQALGHVESGSHLIEDKRWDEALRELAVAESLEHSPAARLFASMLAGKRALALAGAGRLDEADAQATRSLALWDGNDDARYAAAGLALRSGRLADAERALEILVRAHPEDPDLRKVLEATRRDRRAAAR